MFTIATSVSHTYLDVAAMCLPSWAANADADEIVVDYFRGRTAGTRAAIWFDNLARRCRNMQDQVRRAVRNHSQLLLMDVDCLSVGSLRDGFCGKPFSVAFWPNFNMGAMWVDCSLDWPFVEFFDEFVDRAVRRCTDLKEKDDINPAGDQDIMWEMLWAREPAVHKLDHWKWNFRLSPRTEEERILAHRKEVRLLHLRIKSFGGDLSHPRIAFCRQLFPQAFKVIR